jgi:hypothetical protein
MGRDEQTNNKQKTKPKTTTTKNLQVQNNRISVLV